MPPDRRVPVPSPVADLNALPEVLADGGVRGLVLRSARVAGDQRRQFRPMQVLVRGSQRHAAIGALDRLAWRAAWVPGGKLRLLPGTACWWDDGTFLELYWALPAAPFPSVALHRLEQELWASAPDADAPLVTPDSAALLVHLAVQSLRPGRGRDAAWTDFTELRGNVDPNSARSLARGAGVSRGLARCLAAADAGSRPSGPPYEGPRGIAWAAAAALQAAARPRQVRRLLAASPAFGDATLRFRTSGVEVRCDPGVFVPSASVDLLIAAAQDRLAVMGERPVIVDLGTGCGPVAVALATEHPGAEVHAVDLAAAAVRSAGSNARALGLGGVHVHRGSLLQPLPDAVLGRVDVLVANLPYIPAVKGLAIGSVPGSTIIGQGEDGLGLHRALLREAVSVLRPGGVVILQMLASQWERFALELAVAGYRPEIAAAAGSFVIGAAERVIDPSAVGLD